MLRKAQSKKELNDDFVKSNKVIVDMVKKSKQLQDNLKKKESYEHFPFVAGEMIEKHRGELGIQLKKDLQSYLHYSKDKRNIYG